jgi:GNAT superfamily N-acetyltransferase
VVAGARFAHREDDRDLARPITGLKHSAGVSDVFLVPATPADAAAIAALHAESWQSAYRGLLPDKFLDGPVVVERLNLWNDRMLAPGAERRFVLKALGAEASADGVAKVALTEGALVGFVCVLLDAEPAWGALIDNIHVKPGMKRTGIGRRLLQAAREWVAVAAPGQRMHLTVMEGNLAARRFYDRQGGVVVERKTVEVLPGTHVPILRYIWDP